MFYMVLTQPTYSHMNCPAPAKSWQLWRMPDSCPISERQKRKKEIILPYFSVNFPQLKHLFM